MCLCRLHIAVFEDIDARRQSAICAVQAVAVCFGREVETAQIVCVWEGDVLDDWCALLSRVLWLLTVPKFPRVTYRGLQSLQRHPCPVALVLEGQDHLLLLLLPVANLPVGYTSEGMVTCCISACAGKAASAAMNDFSALPSGLRT
jgi:hypothetical protein